MTITIITAEHRQRGGKHGHEKVRHICVDCNHPYYVGKNASRSVRCPTCKPVYRAEYYRAKRTRGIISGTAFGGPYRVVYDPLDTFGNNSSFTRPEIDDMLRLEYLAIGTMFQRDGNSYVVEACRNDGLVLRRVEAEPA